MPQHELPFSVDRICKKCRDRAEEHVYESPSAAVCGKGDIEDDEAEYDQYLRDQERIEHRFPRLPVDGDAQGIGEERYRYPEERVPCYGLLHPSFLLWIRYSVTSTAFAAKKKVTKSDISDIAAISSHADLRSSKFSITSTPAGTKKSAI